MSHRRVWVGMVAVGLVLAMGLMGCSAGGTSTAGTPAAKKIRVGVTVYNMSSFITQGKEGMESYAAANNVELLWNSANNDVATQATQVCLLYTSPSPRD